jgi:aminoglycoside 6'-N-acetyltransferase
MRRTVATGSDILRRMHPFARDGDLAIRRLRDDPADFAAMARWRAAPHVHEWWDPDEPAPSAERIAQTYRDRTEPDHRTTGCIIELDGRPIGYLQFYRWREWEDEAEEVDVDAGPASWGIDIHIGEPALIDQGLGSRAVGAICRYLAEERGATDVRLTTELTNHRAQRAYEKAGFVKLKHVLDMDTRDGERVWCWLMRWDPAAPPSG